MVFLRALVVLACVMAFVPLAPAHEPPRPKPTCQPPSDWGYHDYVRDATVDRGWATEYQHLGKVPVVRDSYTAIQYTVVVTAYTSRVVDGNAEECLDWWEAPLFAAGTETCEAMASPPGLHQAACETPLPSFPIDHEFEFGYGAAVLPVVTGDWDDWWAGGSMPCLFSIGHHTSQVFAQESGGLVGPRFAVGSDGYVAPEDPHQPWESGATCGDGVIEPCDWSPPPPSSAPFPVNAGVDLVQQTWWSATEDPGRTCFVEDCLVTFALVLGAPSGGYAPCPPGGDGAYWVFLLPDLDTGHLPLAGHVWTG